MVGLWPPLFAGEMFWGSSQGLQARGNWWYNFASASIWPQLLLGKIFGDLHWDFKLGKHFWDLLGDFGLWVFSGIVLLWPFSGHHFLLVKSFLDIHWDF